MAANDGKNRLFQEKPHGRAAQAAQPSCFDKLSMRNSNLSP
jgi:hypothetical protein